MRRSLILPIIVFLFPSTSFGQSALQTAAAGMSPGQWLLLSTNGGYPGVMRPPDGGSLLEFAERGTWNPIAKKVMFVGGAHPGTSTNCGSTRFVEYVDSTNTWDNTLPNPCPTFDNAGGIGTTNLVHPYDHQDVNPFTGDLYHRQYTSGKVMKFSQTTQTWSQCSQFNHAGSSTNWNNLDNFQADGSLVYFSDRNSLIMLDGDWGLWELSLASGNCTGSWNLLATTNGGQGGTSVPVLTGIGSSGNIAAYSALCHCVLVGNGGTSKLYKYDRNGGLTVIATAPKNIQIPQAGAGSVFTVDPNTGHFLLFDNADAATTVYDYDPVANSWATISRTNSIFPGPEGGNFDVIAVPIWDYKVTMFFSAGGGGTISGNVYLYKHAAPTAEMDFAVRTSDPNVFTSNGFDSQSDISGAFGANHGNCCAGSPSNGMFFETSIKASGGGGPIGGGTPGGGSLRCDIPANFASSDPCQDFFQNFSTTNTLSFGDNSSFYLEWRQFFPTAYLNEVHTGGDGWKQMILSKGDTPPCSPGNTVGNCFGSCTDNELVAFNSQEIGHQMYYDSCQNFSPLQVTAASPWNGSNHLRQNVPAPNGTICNVSTDAGCNRCWGSLNPNSGQPGSTRFPPLGSCVGYFPNEWMTFKVHVQLGTWNSGNVCDGGFQQTSGGPFYPGYQNSQVDAWIARAGQPFQKIVSFPLCMIAPAHETYGKVWFLVYDTNSTNQGPSAKSVYWDELILSTADIAAPGQAAAAPSGSPAVSLSPSSLSFGNQPLQVTSGSQVITLTNTGTATLTISSITRTGTNPGDYNNSACIDPNTLQAVTSVAVGLNCRISITFTPTATGSRTANLTLNTNASSSPDNATLTGTGQAPVAGFNPTSLSFGGIKVSLSSGSQSITLTNTGNATMSISSIALTGTNAADFSQTNNCPASLAVNTSCNVTVTFTPLLIGVRSANVTVTSNTVTSPDAAGLSGTGFLPVTGVGTISGVGSIKIQP